MSDLLQNLFEEYKNAVCQNSAAIAQFESGFRFVSYAIAGRFQDSTIFSELLYSASNLLVLFNDAIIQKANGILPQVTASQQRLQSLVTVVEYVGVFIEMAAFRIYGDVGRWIAIAVLQLAKSVCRFLLLAKYQVGIQTVPPICPIDREVFLKPTDSDSKLQESQAEENSELNESTNNSSSPSLTFTLKRSGKVMRTISTAPPIINRDWKLPQEELEGKTKKKKAKVNSCPSQLTREQTWGECFYIWKPLIHLSSLAVCGTSSFKPWLLSAALDAGSLYLLGDSEKLNVQERSELQRRYLTMAMYLLRSPLYDRFSKQKLLRIMRALSDNIPGLSIIMVPLMEYLPVWQQMYFYTWST